MISPTASVDGGRAWLVVASAFASSFVVFGIIYSFGAFLVPMSTDFDANPAATSAFFSITSLIYYALNVFGGRAADRFGPRAIVVTGASILAIGLGATALVHTMWVGYLTYGLGVGIGAACCYIPTLAAVGRWFVKQRNLALGIAAAGSGAGTMAVPPIAAALIHSVGWRTTMIVFAVAAAVILLGCAAAVQPAAIERNDGDAGPTLKVLLGSRAFVMLYVSWTLATTALFVPFVYLPAFARELGASEVAAAALVSLIGGASILGRLVLGPIGDRLGVLRLFKATVLMMAISYLIWLIAPSYLWLAVFAVVLGVNYGSRIAAVPVVLIDFFGVDGLGATLGVFFTATGLAALLGPLLAGIAVELSGGFRGGILFALAVGTLGFVAIAPLRAR